MSTLYARRRALPGVTQQQARVLLVGGTPSPLDSALAFTIGYGVTGYGWEGGEADNPDDPGGFTWRGITLTNFRDWRDDPDATSAELLAMPEAEIVAFYGCGYWNPICGNQLPPSIALSVFDMGVNAGPGTSARLLQRGIGFSGDDVDGSIGPMTLGRVAQCDAAALLPVLHDAQLAYYIKLAGWAEFGTGWRNRAAARLTAALALLPGA